MKKTIALAGGSTGGHIFPLLSIYNYLKEEYNFVWFGEKNSLEEKIAKEHNITFIKIKSGKLRRYFSIKTLYEPFLNIIGIIQSIYYIKKYHIDIVFSKGGYVSIPTAIGAKLVQKNLFIHESDTIHGFSNKVIGKIANKVFYSFNNNKIDNKKHILSGQILNGELIDKIEDLKIKENKKLEVLVIGGSLGARNIFNALLKILNNLKQINFTIILGTKNGNFKKEFEKYKNIKIYNFISQDELGKIYKKIDIAITRAGATSLWEQYIFGIHSIIIPLNNSAGNHQKINAKYFKNNFGSDILEDDENLNINLEKKLKKYLTLRKKGLNLKDFFKPLQIIKENIKY